MSKMDKILGYVGFGLGVLGLGAYLNSKVTQNSYSNKEFAHTGIIKEYGYSDLINDIMDSELPSFSKEKCVNLVKRDLDSEYYLSVKSIIESREPSFIKENMIKGLS